MEKMAYIKKVSPTISAPPTTATTIKHRQGRSERKKLPGIKPSHA